MKYTTNRVKYLRRKYLQCNDKGFSSRICKKFLQINKKRTFSAINIIKKREWSVHRRETTNGNAGIQIYSTFLIFREIKIQTTYSPVRLSNIKGFNDTSVYEDVRNVILSYSLKF